MDDESQLTNARRGRDGQAQIRYRHPDGTINEWGVGCDADYDDDESLRRHLERWCHGYKYLGARIVRVKDDTVVMDTRIHG